MSIIKVSRNNQITLPRKLRDKLHITPGEYLEIEESDGKIILQPVKVIPSDQAYFYTEEWQAGEAEADRDIEEGRLIGPFDNAEDAVKALREYKE